MLESSISITGFATLQGQKVHLEDRQIRAYVNSRQTDTVAFPASDFVDTHKVLRLQQY
jgi:hypothetical protein